MEDPLDNEKLDDSKLFTDLKHFSKSMYLRQCPRLTSTFVLQTQVLDRLANLMLGKRNQPEIMSMHSQLDTLLKLHEYVLEL